MWSICTRKCMHALSGFYKLGGVCVCVHARALCANMLNKPRHPTDHLQHCMCVCVCVRARACVCVCVRTCWTSPAHPQELSVPLLSY